MRSINREIVGGFIFSNDGHILIGRSKPGGVYPGYMMIPGGGIEEGESKEEALKREVLEEVGVDITQASITALDSSKSGESEKLLHTGERVLVRMHFNDFIVRIPKPAAEIPLLSGDDFIGATWVPTQKLPEYKLVGATKTRIKEMGLL